jgi:branched chain amino acid efflux pump
VSGLTLGVVIAGLTLVTLVSRSLFLVLGDRVPIPSRIQRGLRYAPACALAALIVPQLVLHDQTLQLTLANPRLDAGLIALLVMRISHNMLAAMVTGMAAFLVLRVLV